MGINWAPVSEQTSTVHVSWYHRYHKRSPVQPALRSFYPIHNSIIYFFTVQLKPLSYACLMPRYQSLSMRSYIYNFLSIFHPICATELIILDKLLQQYTAGLNTHVQYFIHFILFPEYSVLRIWAQTYTMRSLTNFNATVTSRLPAGTAWLIAKRYKVFPIRVKYRSTTTKWT
jgi:hypothetical protein